jgi:hypothetical protein
VAGAFALALALAACSSGSDDDADSGGDDGGAAATDPSGSGDSNGSGDSGELLALTYNVAGLPDVLSGSNPEVNTELIGPLLNDYDLVLLQETWKTPDPNPLAPIRVYHEILEASSEHPHQSASAEQPLGSDPSRSTALLADGLNYFSRFPLGEVTRVPWEGCFGGADTSDGGAGDCLAFKGFSVVTVTLAEGVEVDVYNLHAEAGGTDEDQRLQRDDFVLLAAFIEGHSAGRPVILGGDTNLHTDEVPEDPQDVEDSDIWNDFLAATEMADVCTSLDCPEPGRIDKFASRSGGGVTIDPLTWQFETDKFVRDDGEPLSDHEALAVRFRWERTGD